VSIIRDLAILKQAKEGSQPGDPSLVLNKLSPRELAGDVIAFVQE